MNKTPVSQAHITSPLPEIGFIKLPQILELIPVSKSAWYLGIQEGRFPKSVKLGKNTAAWRVEAIRELIEQLGEQE